MKTKFYQRNRSYKRETSKNWKHEVLKTRITKTYRRAQQ